MVIRDEPSALAHSKGMSVTPGYRPKARAVPNLHGLTAKVLPEPLPMRCLVSSTSSTGPTVRRGPLTASSAGAPWAGLALACCSAPQLRPSAPSVPTSSALSGYILAPLNVCFYFNRYLIFLAFYHPLYLRANFIRISNYIASSYI